MLLDYGQRCVHIWSPCSDLCITLKHKSSSHQIHTKKDRIRLNRLLMNRHLQGKMSMWMPANVFAAFLIDFLKNYITRHNESVTNVEHVDWLGTSTLNIMRRAWFPKPIRMYRLRFHCSITELSRRRCHHKCNGALHFVIISVSKGFVFSEDFFVPNRKTDQHFGVK